MSRPLAVFGLAACFASSALLAAGCQEEPGALICAETEVLSTGDGLYSRPQDLLLEGCEPGALADFDPNGLWYYEEEDHGLFGGIGPVRFDLSCREGLSVEHSDIFGATAIQEHAFSEDALFWRREQHYESVGFTVVEAYSICNLTSLGTPVGWFARCYIEDEGEGEGASECIERGVSLQRFGRRAGESEASGLRLVSEFRGDWGDAFVANVRVIGDRAYVAASTAGLRIVDVSTLDSPVELGAMPAEEGENINDVKIVAGPGDTTYALLASSTRGLVIVEVTDAASPRVVIAFTQTGEVGDGLHTLFTETIDDETRVYLADGASGLVTIWDVSDPESASKLGEYRAPDPDWAVHDLSVRNGRMYLNATIGGLLVVDALDTPGNPQLLGRYAPASQRYSHSNWVTEVDGKPIIVHGDEGFDAHFKILDADPSSDDFLTPIGSYQTRSQVSAHNVMAVGNKAYAAYYQDGIRVLDLSDPTAPVLDAYFNTWDPEASEQGIFQGAVGLDVDVERGLIFAADSPRGLLILQEE